MKTKVQFLVLLSAFILQRSAFSQEARTPIGQPVSPATLPININSPGSYYLTGNLRAPAGYTGNGIFVNTSNVTIDLNGFTLFGVAGGTGAGVRIADTAGYVTIRNGTIGGWSSYGINGIHGTGLRVENVRAINNLSCGIAVGGLGVVSNCYSDLNVGSGISCTGGCLITKCQTNGTSGSPGSGIDMGGNSVINDCISNGDIIGMRMTTDSQLSNCRVSDPHGGSAFLFGNHCLFDRCTATGAGGTGSAFCGFVSSLYSTNCVFRSCSASFSASQGSMFVAGTGSTFENCNGTGAAAGFLVIGDNNDANGANASFINCSATANQAWGFQAGAGSSFLNCTASQNGRYNFLTGDGCTLNGCTALGRSSLGPLPIGFKVQSGCTLINCTATGHRGDGFQYISGCLLSGNTSRGNGVAGATVANGFRGFGTNNRLDGNHAVSNTGTGILSLSTTADFIIRNTSFDNTIANYNPSTGTHAGPLGTPPSATSPWANF